METGLDKLMKRRRSALRLLLITLCGFAFLVSGVGFDFSEKRVRLPAAELRLLAGAVKHPGFPRTAGQAVWLVRQNLAGFHESNPDISFNSFFHRAGIGYGRPYAILASVIQPLPEMPPAEAIKQPEPEPGSETQTGSQTGNGFVVAFYCTHNGESYVPDDRVGRHNGTRGLINQVARTMAQEMEKQGFEATYNETMHDAPDYNMAYARSRETVTAMVDADPGLAALIDVHRDAIPHSKQGAVVTIDGEAMAQILLIVGSDQRRENPRWRENLAFANLLYQRGQENYPGLIRGVRVKAGTYNQDLASPALLVEVGNEYNHLAEAERSARLFARLLAESLEEQGQGGTERGGI